MRIFNFKIKSSVKRKITQRSILNVLDEKVRYFVVMTGVQFRKAFDEITTFSARKYSGAPSGVVELKGMLSFGGLQGAWSDNVEILQPSY